MKKTFLLIILFVSLAGVASAATTGQLTYTPLEPLPGTVNGWGETQQLPALLSALFKLLITLGSLFAVVMLVVAGIGYMVSEAAVDIEKAKQRAQAALWGLLLLAGSWLILYTINPELLNFKLLVGNTTSAPPGGSESKESNPLQPNMSVGSGVPNDQVTKSACGDSTCEVWGNYFTYDVGAFGNEEVKGAYETFKSQCETAHYDSKTNTNRQGSLKTFEASAAGTQNTNGVVCLLQ